MISLMSKAKHFVKYSEINFSLSSVIKDCITEAIEFLFLDDTKTMTSSLM